jgi:FHS family L-fucose permease-like MFS transporter
MFFLILFTKMPQTGHANSIHPMQSFRRLMNNKTFREGVVAQVFYVAAQIMVWTFIIQYADNLGIDKATAQRYNIVAMAMFIGSRFISTALMKYFNPRLLLMIFAIGAMTTTAMAILFEGMFGLYSLVAISAFMSLMFPTIYGIALRDVGADATLGAALLVMAIVGGALMPTLQGAIIDLGRVAWLPAVNASFVLPFICFVVIAIFAYRSHKHELAMSKA